MVIVIPAIVRLVVVTSTLITLLGPTIADLELDELTTPPSAEPSEADERDDRHRPPRRERRAHHLDASQAPMAIQPGAVAADRPAQAATEGEANPTADDHPAGNDRAAGEPARSDGTDASIRRAQQDGEAVIGTIDPDRPFDPAELPDAIRQALPRSPTDAALRSPLATGPAIDLGGDGMTVQQGCHLQCITSGVALARGVNAELFVTTNVPAKIRLDVYGGPSVRTFTSPANVTSFAVLVDGLEPGTQYPVVARATDAKGHTADALGAFTTLRRQAEVSFHLDWNVPSVPLESTPTAYHFHYRVDGSWVPGLSSSSPYPYPLPALPAPVVVTDAPAELDVGAQAVAARDTGFTPNQLADTCVTNEAPFGPHGGNGPGFASPFGFPLYAAAPGGTCFEVTWVSAIPTCLNGVLLDVRPPGATSWLHHQHKLTLGTACYDTPMDIEVPVTIDVSYVP